LSVPQFWALSPQSSVLSPRSFRYPPTRKCFIMFQNDSFSLSPAKRTRDAQPAKHTTKLDKGGHATLHPQHNSRPTNILQQKRYPPAKRCKTLHFPCSQAPLAIQI